MSGRIADYALLSDCQSAALVDRNGSIDWWCVPRFDSRSCFARLLDDDAGHWSIRPAVTFDSDRAYDNETLVLRTSFRTRDSTVDLTDALLLSTEPSRKPDDSAGHMLGFASPHVLTRLVEGRSGRVSLRVEFRPRFEYGLVTPAVQVSGGILVTLGGPDRLRLTVTPTPNDAWRVEEPGLATLELTVEAGQCYAFTLAHREGMTGPLPEVPDARGAVEQTSAAWRSWADLHRGFHGFATSRVRDSAMVLQALTYQPTGAIIAAPTTSLPEIVGGDRNWDYRFGWLRARA